MLKITQNTVTEPHDNRREAQQLAAIYTSMLRSRTREYRDLPQTSNPAP